MGLNKNLHKARNAENDEFYTQLSDIEKELRHYTKHFHEKVVYCNCDDPRVSNFYHYFSHHFTRLGIKRLITTCYQNQERDLFSRHDSEKSISLELLGDEKRKDGSCLPPDPMIRQLEGDGDFRSKECIELLAQADIVVTNPPFSLFREYVAQLIEYDKKFIIIGNKNAITYKEIFPLIKTNQMWLGYGFSNGNAFFRVGDVERYKTKAYFDGKTGLVKFRNVGWFTNLDFPKRHEELILTKPYTPENYPIYDNYDGIEVSRVSDIPKDYDGIMGVPITFLDHHNPNQFELIGHMSSTTVTEFNFGYPYINGIKKYARILIRNMEPLR